MKSAYSTVRSTTTLLGLLGLALACGSGPYDSSFRSKKLAMDSSRPAPLLEGFVVAPDLAVHAVDVQAAGPTSAWVAQRVRTDRAALEALVATGCRLDFERYSPPSGADDHWSASLSATLTIDLAGLPDLTSRMDRIDACLLPLLAVSAPNFEDVAGTEGRHAIAVGPQELLVSNANQHLPALLTTEKQAMDAVLTAPLPLHPEDRRCTPTGQVHQVVSTLAGVVLAPELECRTLVGPPTPQG